MPSPGRSVRTPPPRLASRRCRAGNLPASRPGWPGSSVAWHWPGWSLPAPHHHPDPDEAPPGEPAGTRDGAQHDPGHGRTVPGDVADTGVTGTEDAAHQGGYT